MEYITNYLTERDLAIPIERIKEVIEFLPYGNVVRLMIQWQAVTGCRSIELNRMFIDKLIKNFDGWIMIWQPGKRQKKERREHIPNKLKEELDYYRSTNSVPERALFAITAKTLRKMFDRDVRPLLSQEWKEVLPGNNGGASHSFVLQLKGIRKTWATLEFARQLDKWKDSGVALEMTSKKMKHSSTYMTAYYYVSNFEKLNIEKYRYLSYQEILSSGHQKRISDY